MEIFKQKTNCLLAILLLSSLNLYISCFGSIKQENNFQVCFEKKTDRNVTYIHDENVNYLSFKETIVFLESMCYSSVI